MKPKSGKLEDEYAYATECELATLSELCFLKKSSFHEITRHRSISLHMLKVCQEHRGNMSDDQARVLNILDEAQERSLEACLTSFMRDRFSHPRRFDRWFDNFRREKRARVGL